MRPDLFDLPPVGPEGFAYRADFLAAAEEAGLLAELAALPFEPFQFRGFEGRRRVCSFGWRYDFNGPGLTPAAPMPAWLHAVRQRAEAFAGVTVGGFQHVLINEYRPGAPIGWHKDRPAFDKVVGISLGGAEVLRFRRRSGAGWSRREVMLEPRSAYLLTGPARHDWEHSLREARALRYSITFRSLVDPGRLRLA